jgi:ketosteroid isomerase-like protein
VKEERATVKNPIYRIGFVIALLAGLVSVAAGQEAAGAVGKEAQAAKWRNELLQADRDFNGMAQKEGIAKAFVHFAADEVILLRDKQPPVFGKAALQAHYAQSEAGYSLSWWPEKADVGAAGDLGYTFGRWELSAKDANGQETKLYGVYVTVWKRQADGSWKYVLDGGNETPAPEK